jgi:formyl-CoA transferase
VWDYAELFADPQAASRGLRVQVCDPRGKPVDLIGTPFHVAGTEPPAPTLPPQLGEHTEEVLTQVLGLDSEQIRSLRAKGVI